MQQSMSRKLNNGSTQSFLIETMITQTSEVAVVVHKNKKIMEIEPGQGLKPLLTLGILIANSLLNTAKNKLSFCRNGLSGAIQAIANLNSGSIAMGVQIWRQSKTSSKPWLTYHESNSKYIGTFEVRLGREFAQSRFMLSNRP